MHTCMDLYFTPAQIYPINALVPQRNYLIGSILHNGMKSRNDMIIYFNVNQLERVITK